LWYGHSARSPKQEVVSARLSLQYRLRIAEMPSVTLISLSADVNTRTLETNKIIRADKLIYIIFYIIFLT
jgi:hypothetical protein